MTSNKKVRPVNDKIYSHSTAFFVTAAHPSSYFSVEDMKDAKPSLCVQGGSRQGASSCRPALVVLIEIRIDDLRIAIRLRIHDAVVSVA